jgi:hypothetical protein
MMKNKDDGDFPDFGGDDNGQPDQPEFEGDDNE